MFRRGSLAAGLGLALMKSALAMPSWDGTWIGGWDEGDGIQIIVTGNKVTAVGRGDAYPEILSSEVSPEGSMLAVWWIGGDGLLQRAGESEATLSLRERDKPARNFSVHRE